MAMSAVPAQEAVASDVAVLHPGFAGVSYPVALQEAKILPRYPSEALAAGAGGTVTLAALVRPDGSVAGTQVLACDSPALGFEAAAEWAVSQWRFKPARKSGEAVTSYVVIRADFRDTGRVRADTVLPTLNARGAPMTWGGAGELESLAAASGGARVKIPGITLPEDPGAQPKNHDGEDPVHRAALPPCGPRSKGCLYEVPAYPDKGPVSRPAPIAIGERK
jgi:TonB family protein